jgi:hypothetical protein
MARNDLPQKQKPPEFRGFFSCAGLQLDFPAQQYQGVAEVWVPFDEVIAVGWT